MYLTEWVVVLSKVREGEVVVDQHHDHGGQEGGGRHREEGKARQQGQVGHLHKSRQVGYLFLSTKFEVYKNFNHILTRHISAVIKTLKLNDICI